MIKLMPELPSHVVGLIASGQVTAEDYESVRDPRGRDRPGDARKNPAVLSHRSRMDRIHRRRNVERRQGGTLTYDSLGKGSVVTDVE